MVATSTVLGLIQHIVFKWCPNKQKLFYKCLKYTKNTQKFTQKQTQVMPRKELLINQQEYWF